MNRFQTTPRRGRLSAGRRRKFEGGDMKGTVGKVFVVVVAILSLVVAASAGVIATQCV